jgi:Flp pilus assembly protein TadG
MTFADIYQSFLPMFRRLRSDRRGATALVFALGATASFGLVGLATEGGAWYLEKRHGQNAADAAAIAGVVALANNQGTAAATTSANDAAALTGDTNGLSIATGTFSNGSFTASATQATAVKAVVTATPTPLFSALFLKSVTIGETAVAALAATGPVCMLAGAGGLSFGGSTSVTAQGCTIASNKTGSQSIVGASTSHVSATQSLVAAGGCSGCTGLTTPPLTYQPPTPNPPGLTAIEALTLPTTTGTKCNNNSTSPVAYVPSDPTPTINCQGFTMSGNPTVNLTPGTYIFYNSSISLNNGILECSTCTGVGNSGVTIIMTGSSGSNVGTIDIKGNVTVNLVAPAVNSYNSAFNGVLFYTDYRAPIGNTVKLTGDSSSTYGGAMYFPTSNVTFIGNSGGSVPSCSEIVSYSMNFTGNSGFNISGCSTNNVTQTRTVRLVQ